MKLAAFALFWASCAVGFGADPQHYLPSVGPNPLRFRSVAPTNSPAELLAPLPPPVEAAEPAKPVPPVHQAEAPALSSPAAPPPSPKAAPRTEMPPAAPPEVEAVPSKSPSARLPEETTEAMTPQMLMQYFRGVGGADEGFVSLPVLFTPPVPVGPEPSSRASYSVQPGPVAGPGTPSPTPP